MEAFNTHRGILATLDRANVDTDAIIPKQFLKSIKRTGFGEQLFFDWRFLPDGRPDPEFILNQNPFRQATILVARNNFGCGSSREHAVWAVHQYGFKAVLAPWKMHGHTRIPAFADIFRNNSSKNGLLTVELSEAEIEQIFAAVRCKPGIEATLDLDKQSVTVHGKDILSFRFEMDPAVKNRLMRGLDDIGITLEHENAIRTFENKHKTQLKK